MTQAVLREGIARLEAAGVANPRSEAEWLLSRLVGKAPLELYLDTCDVSTAIQAQFRAQLEARVAGTPLQYLVGETDFFGESIAVEPGVFIPRPETETIVEAALAALEGRAATCGRPLRLLDLGTGSGCIAVTLAQRLPTCVVVGVELSWNTLRIAQRNLSRYRLGTRVHLIQGQWVEPIRGRFDGIVSNPPYIPSDDIARLPLDVRQEPHASLDGGPDGMHALRHILEQAPRLLEPGGILVLECGEAHVDQLVRQARAASWVQTVTPLYDLAARPRGVCVTQQ